jgi:hypothetical protein
VERLKEFERPVIKLNDKTGVIPTVIKPPPASYAHKSAVDSDGLLASYIAHLERLEDLVKDRNTAYNNNNNETSSSAPKINPHGVVYPSLAPLPITNNANYTYGVPLETSFG